MSVITRALGRPAVLGGVALLLLLGAGALGLRAAGAAASPPPPAAPADAAPSTILVFVSGAVLHPGLYDLSPDARVSDAIAAAGGLLPDADPSRLPDLAGRVHDGKQVNVPFRGGSTRGSSKAARLDVNSASVAELEQVPGMPAGLPQAIVDHRSMWGPFHTLTELRDDLGVDPHEMTALSPYLTVVPPG